MEQFERLFGFPILPIYIDERSYSMNEKIYRAGDKAYIHIQKSDDGYNYDFSIYGQDDLKLIDGGFTDFGECDTFVSFNNMARMIADDFGMESEELCEASIDILDEIDNANSICESKPKYIDEDKITPPCPDIDINDVKEYGYTYDGMYPLDEETAIDLIRNYCDVYLLYPDGTEAMANDEKEIHEHANSHWGHGYLGVEKETWDRICYRYESGRELDAREKAFFESCKDGFAIYQLKSVYENDDIVFMNSQYLKSRNIPVDASRYRFVYSGDMQMVYPTLVHKADEKASKLNACPNYYFTPENILDVIYEKLNYCKPDDYHTRSASVSDVFVLRQNGKLSAYYVDSIGYTKLDKFVSQICKESEE